MKLVTAVVAPHRWEEVRAALEMVGISGITVTEVTGSGDPFAAVRLEVVVDDHEVDGVCTAITRWGRTSPPDALRLWVLPVDSLVRVRTRDQDVAAI